MNLTTILLAAAWIQTPQTLDADLEAALGVVGLSQRTARFDPTTLNFFGGGEFTTPLFQGLNSDPWRLPFVAATIRGDLSTMAGRPSDSMMAVSRLAGFGVRRTLLGNPNEAIEAEAKKAGSLPAAIAEMKKAGVLLAAQPVTDAIPSDVQSAAALVMKAALRSVGYRRAAIQRFASPTQAYNLLSKGLADEAAGSDFDPFLVLMRQVDLSYMATAAHDMAMASQTALSWIGAVPETAVYQWSAQTTWGSITLSGGTKSVHGTGPSLLVIDTGGHDTYLNAPSNASVANWVSVTLDTAGNDNYLSAADLEFQAVSKYTNRKGAGWMPGPGGALMGCAFLLDSTGDDVYRSHRSGLGSGRFGFAAIMDTEGNDVYDGYADSIGFGMFGVGMIDDMRGNDRYEGFSQVQGIGQTKGVGYIADRAGDDRYIANDQEIDFPSPQSGEHNVSMSQGAGNGRRADYSDGHNLSGGIGILFDAEGKDGYSVAVFGQGVGYWQGVGFLWDSGIQDDIYLGQWYAQAAAAHFAFGYLEDQGGNDTYTAPMNMAQGAGHDFSVGFLLDRAGNDLHKAPNLSLGAGNANGIGIFADLEGTDTYESNGVTLGKAAEATKGSLRARALCLGVFFDGGGQDTYTANAPWASNGGRIANWTDQGWRPEESQMGVFWDR